MEDKIVLDQTAQLAAEPVSAQSVALLVIYLLAIVVGIYFLTKLIAKKSLQRGIKKPAKGGGVRWFSSNRAEPGRLLGVVDRIAIDRDKTLTVVEFEGKYYMLGVTHQEIKLLDKVPIPEADLARGEAESGDAEATNEEIDGAERSSDTDETAFYAAAESSFGDYLKQLWTNMKLGIYRFFHRGKNPPQDFETQLKEKLKTGQESTVMEDSSEQK